MAGTSTDTPNELEAHGLPEQGYAKSESSIFCRTGAETNCISCADIYVPTHLTKMTAVSRPRCSSYQ